MQLATGEAPIRPNRSELIRVGIYYVAFYMAWLIVRNWLNPDSQTVFWGLCTAFAKIVIWDLPVIFYIKSVDKTEWVTSLKLNQKIASWRWLVVPITVLVVYLLVVNNGLFHQAFRVKTGFSEWLNAVILAGTLEELLFRGFILNKLSSKLKFWHANLLTSILFVLVHYPLWISQRDPVVSIALNTIYIGVFSYVAGYIWKKTNSLWGSVIFHTTNNLLVDLGF